MKRRVLLHTNPPWIKTGLAENAKTLLKYFYKTGKYEIGQYCSQTSVGDPNLRFTPWKSYGCLPTDPRIVNELNADPGKARDATYGSWNIDTVVKEFKPDIYIGSDDIWSFPKAHYIEKPWWNKINSILHVTVDSLPVLEQAYEQAMLTKNYFTWAKFAMKEMQLRSSACSHVRQIYGAMDIGKFSPISGQDKLNLRKQFGISENTTIFLFVGRNQLRKQFVHCLEAFGQFKKDYPQADAKLWFHTSFSEKGSGWDIPKMAAYYGVKLEDILSTYVCKHCGSWHVASYRGEDLDCPYCGAKKSMITATIVNGVPDDQMRYVYGLADACVSAFSSGGQEYHNSQSLLCGKPLASTNYSSGADFCEQPFVYSLGYSTYIEQGTNFIKASTNIKDIKYFFTKIWKSSKRDLEEIGEKGRDWAVKTFAIESIGRQWENVFDNLKPVEWSSISLVPDMKNDKFAFPEIEDENQFIFALYKNILNMDEPENGSGFVNWKNALRNGASRQSIYEYFINEAKKENSKNNVPVDDFSSFIDKSRNKKRGLLLVKESIGDIIIITSLFRSFHDQHPDTDLYVMTDPQYRELIDGNPYVYRVIPYNSIFEQEMVAMGAGQPKSEAFFDYYYHTCVQTQRILSYLSQPSTAFNLNYA